MRSSAYASTVIMSTTYTLSGSLVVVSVISLVAGSGASASLLLLHLEEYLECLLQVIWAGGCYQLLRQKQYPSFFFFFYDFVFCSPENGVCVAGRFRNIAITIIEGGLDVPQIQQTSRLIIYWDTYTDLT